MIILILILLLHVVSTIIWFTNYKIINGRVFFSTHKRTNAFIFFLLLPCISYAIALIIVAFFINSMRNYTSYWLAFVVSMLSLASIIFMIKRNLREMIPGLLSVTLPICFIFINRYILMIIGLTVLVLFMGYTELIQLFWGGKNRLKSFLLNLLVNNAVISLTAGVCWKLVYVTKYPSALHVYVFLSQIIVLLFVSWRPGYWLKN